MACTSLVVFHGLFYFHQHSLSLLVTDAESEIRKTVSWFQTAAAAAV